MPTPSRPPRCSAVSTHLLIQSGIDRSLGPGQYLTGSGLDIRLFDNPSGEVDVAWKLSVARNLVQHLSDTCTSGLTVDLRYRLNACGI